MAPNPLSASAAGNKNQIPNNSSINPLQSPQNVTPGAARSISKSTTITSIPAHLGANSLSEAARLGLLYPDYPLPYSMTYNPTSTEDVTSPGADPDHPITYRVTRTESVTYHGLDPNRSEGNEGSGKDEANTVSSVVVRGEGLKNSAARETDPIIARAGALGDGLINVSGHQMRITSVVRYCAKCQKQLEKWEFDGYRVPGYERAFCEKCVEGDDCEADMGDKEFDESEL